MIRGRGAARRLSASLGLFAVLFQALLFGWHHHDPVRAGHLPAPIVANRITPPQAVDDEDGCEICQVLHHLTAAPFDLAAMRPSPAPALISDTGGAAFVGRPHAIGFFSRAPPSSEAAIG